MRSFSRLVLVTTLLLTGCQASGPEATAEGDSDAQGMAPAAPAASPASTNEAGIRDISGFAMWSAAELASRNEALGTRIGEDFSARETLADYGNHRFRFIRRDGDGFPEQHDNIIDVVIVQSGQGELLLGGTLVDPESGSPGEWRGSAIEGGERHPLGPGDVMHIPATVPHSFLVPEGGHFTYVLVKFPAP